VLDCLAVLYNHPFQGSSFLLRPRLIFFLRLRRNLIIGDIESQSQQALALNLSRPNLAMPEGPLAQGGRSYLRYNPLPAVLLFQLLPSLNKIFPFFLLAFLPSFRPSVLLSSYFSVASRVFALDFPRAGTP